MDWHEEAHDHAEKKGCNRCTWKPWETAVWIPTLLVCFGLVLFSLASLTASGPPTCGQRVMTGYGMSHRATARDGCVPSGVPRQRSARP